MERIRISVRNLVEFILRCGDLDLRRGGADKSAMQQGSRLHRKLQGRMGSEYEAEVTLKYLIEREAFSLLLEGRADGIIHEQERVVIDEIKAVYRDIHALTEPNAVHLAQAKCYAYIYATQEKLEQITVRMTYVQIQTEQIRYFYETYSYDKLKGWFSVLIAEYEKWIVFQEDWQKLREKSIEGITFPFAYRSQQRELVSGVYRTIEQKKKLFIQASTGSGKTISAVYPAVQALGRGMADKIFYLTARTITRTVALETFGLLSNQDLQLKVLVIMAKEKICFCEEPECNPDACIYAKGHFDRVNACVFEILNKENMLTSEVIMRYAREHRVCPFELSLDVAVWVDAIICDYNYVFDYDVCLKRFFGEGNSEEYIFLIDEAHNLVDRGRSMYSAELYKEDILELKRQIKPYSKKIEKILNQCNKIFLEWKRSCEHYEQMDDSELATLAIPLTRLLTEMESYLEEEHEEEIHAVLLEHYFQIRHFMNIYDLLDEHYVIYKEWLDGQGKFKVRLFCVDPSRNLCVCLDKGRSSIFFSATLLPIRYYMKLLGGNEEDFAMYAQSSFPSGNCLHLIGNDVSSRYTRRNSREYEKIADYMELLVKAKQGNYIFFFPSYVYMQSVYESFQKRNPKIRTMIQDSHMTEEQREAFLAEFKHKKEESLAAFCVLGGIFSEGIDLTKESLIGAVIVGNGFPQVDTEQEILQKYFQKTEKAGFDYAFRYPGFNKVLQAAGRVIRTEEDKGIVLLLEERLLEREYAKLYPREWSRLEVCDRTGVQARMEEFWNNVSS